MTEPAPDDPGGSPPGSAAPPVATMTGFVRTLRAAGVAADHERAQGFLRALEHLDAGVPGDVYWAGRLTLCAGPDDLPRYDRCFHAYFGGARAVAGPAATASVHRYTASVADSAEGERDGEAAPATASRTEVLRHRDVARLTEAERAEVHRMLAMLRAGRARRRSRRYESAHRGVLDRRRTIRDALKKGEVALLRRRRHTTRPRRVVLFVDVSGSMSPYAETLLRFAHALVRSEPRATRVFSVGTRLTALTAGLRHRDPGTALDEVSRTIPDWSGGTRLGEELKEFLSRHSARGAIAVIASDGWERGDPELLRTQMARLARQAHRVLWVNPHKGYEDYQPLTGGMRAALPYLDALVAGHSLAAYEELTERLAHA
ncbi:VWA domain-containing protein [Nonomuraea sp. MCN248]|uniref:VWA domain-containing protein n=1 Tax=Nonomuraea corallina TaxID=2989783 RepID=A0ABT4SAA8_9ACTN|nr:VWA domain-containing protein [Nonomuraea corallina]MDA0634138.1 VWA domain-containing protein [Nonomuraea corallina]